MLTLIDLNRINCVIIFDPKQICLPNNFVPKLFMIYKMHRNYLIKYYISFILSNIYVQAYASYTLLFEIS